MHWILFFVFAVYCWTGILLDIKGSVNFPYYGVTERTELMKDAFGYMSKMKALIGVAILTALAVVIQLLARDEPQIAAIPAFLLLVPFGSYRLYLWNSNRNLNKENRAEQIERLRFIRDYQVSSNLAPDAFDQALGEYLGNLQVYFRGGRVRYKLFGWIYEEVPNRQNADLTDGLWKCQVRLRRLSLEDERAWFPN